MEQYLHWPNVMMKKFQEKPSKFLEQKKLWISGTVLWAAEAKWKSKSASAGLQLLALINWKWNLLKARAILFEWSFFSGTSAQLTCVSWQEDCRHYTTVRAAKSSFWNFGINLKFHDVRELFNGLLPLKQIFLVFLCVLVVVGPV